MKAHRFIRKRKIKWEELKQHKLNIQGD